MAALFKNRKAWFNFPRTDEAVVKPPVIYPGNSLICLESVCGRRCVKCDEAPANCSSCSCK